MSDISHPTPTETAAALDILKRERAHSLTAREWKHRLAGYGYKLRDTDHGAVVVSAALGHEICAVPDYLQ